MSNEKEAVKQFFETGTLALDLRDETFNQLNTLHTYISTKAGELEDENGIDYNVAKLLVMRTIVEGVDELVHWIAGESVYKGISKRAISEYLGYSGSATIQRKYPMADKIAKVRAYVNKTGRRCGMTFDNGHQIILDPNNDAWNLASALFPDYEEAFSEVAWVNDSDGKKLRVALYMETTEELRKNFLDAVAATVSEVRVEPAFQRVVDRETEDLEFRLWLSKPLPGATS